MQNEPCRVRVITKCRIHCLYGWRCTEGNGVIPQFQIMLIWYWEVHLQGKNQESTTNNRAIQETVNGVVQGKQWPAVFATKLIKVGKRTLQGSLQSNRTQQPWYDTAFSIQVYRRIQGRTSHSTKSVFFSIKSVKVPSMGQTPSRKE
jgi:hypothetical protein